MNVFSINESFFFSRNHTTVLHFSRSAVCYKKNFHWCKCILNVFYLKRICHNVVHQCGEILVYFWLKQNDLDKNLNFLSFHILDILERIFHIFVQNCLHGCHHEYFHNWLQCCPDKLPHFHVHFVHLHVF